VALSCSTLFVNGRDRASCLLFSSVRSCSKHCHLPGSRGLAQVSSASGPPEGPALYSSHAPTTPLQRLTVAGYAALSALRDSKRADMVAALGEVTGRMALERLHRTMLLDPEGLQVLRARPVINEATLDLPGLAALPKGSLGRSYSDFMGKYGFSPDSRSQVRFVDDPDLAYVMQRYREVHDLWHVLSGLPPTVEAELALKWFELVQTGLPVCALSAVFGPLALPRHEPRENSGVMKHWGKDSKDESKSRHGSREVLNGTYLPWALRTGRRARSLICVWYERRWEMTVDEVRRELRVDPAPERPSCARG
ncbi:unnamed protein product, partial [Choristocarpus tenellus]